MPPVRNQVDNAEAVVVSEFGKEFNVDDVYKTESSFIGTLPSVEHFNHVEVPPSSPPNFDEQMMDEVCFTKFEFTNFLF